MSSEEKSDYSDGKNVLQKILNTPTNIPLTLSEDQKNRKFFYELMFGNDQKVEDGK